MQVITSVTQKGQVTIPQAMRRRLGIRAFGRVVLVGAHDHVRVMAAQDILDLAGTYIPKRKKSVLKAREEMEKNYERF